MRRRLRVLAAGLALVAFLGVAVLAVWPVVADAPWEDTVETRERDDRNGDDGPAFTEQQVLQIATPQVAGEFRQYNVRCVDADYRKENHKWVVRCEFFLKDQADQTGRDAAASYVFDDDTGQIEF